MPLAAKDERHLLSCLTTVHHILRLHHGWIYEEIVEIKTGKWGRQFVFFRTLPSISEWRHSWSDVENCQYLLLFIISFWYCKRCVVIALLCRLRQSRWGNLYFCGLWLWRYLSVQCLLSSACWLLFFLHYNSQTFFPLTSRLVPAMDCFHYVIYIIFALWFSLNQMFVIKFLVSFPTVVERTRRSHVFIEVFARQKT